MTGPQTAPQPVYQTYANPGAPYGSSPQIAASPNAASRGWYLRGTSGPAPYGGPSGVYPAGTSNRGDPNDPNDRSAAPRRGFGYLGGPPPGDGSFSLQNPPPGAIPFSNPEAFPDGQPEESRWSGFYIGGMLGNGWASIDRTWTATDHWVAGGTTFGQQSKGFLGGGQIGYNAQLDRFVFGAEASMLSTNFQKTVVAPADSTVGSDPVSADYALKQLYMFSAKVGYAFGDVLPYFKGGWAVGKVSTYTRDSQVSGALLHDAYTEKWQKGPIVGAGVDYMVSPNLVVGLEYDYFKLGSANHYVARVNDYGSPPANPVYASSDVNAKFHMIVGRVMFKF